ncbi:uncharacterized protein LOC111337653 [Stylophora pistillata]|uniref:uncharacterized protein LOC111337653 n=1 Tax=Stylophora pistillata TaxID=50429 RepID=UPI000C038D9F|nr:uncharacterized protein LOC111337653 [Stylophora pistillata]
MFTDWLFNKLLFASGCVLWFVPYLRQSRERLTHVFNRWKLRNAFYSKESSRHRGCLERLQDTFCPSWTCLLKNQGPRSNQVANQQMDNLNNDEGGINNAPPKKRLLNLADLRGMEPELISNATVHEWAKNPSSGRDYALLTMSPTKIERLDRDPSIVNVFEGKLDPRDVALDDAMATSAAAISGYFHSVEVKRLSTILGFEMGASMISDMKAIKRESCCKKLLPLVINITRGLPLIVISAVYFTAGSEWLIKIGGTVFFVIHLILALIGAFADTGAETPNCWEKIARWFIVHVSFVGFVREALSIKNVGSMPPPVMLVSDGGHTENTGILPLLKNRLKKIVVVNGGYTSDEERYGDDLMEALMLARTELNCSFISREGRDVISDLLETFVKPNKPNEKRKPRYYRFKVEYYQDEVGKVGEGEILMIRPRDPRKGDQSEVKTWEEFGFNLEPNDWGESPYLTGDDVDKLTFCCCNFCNRKSWLSFFSEWFCDKFPNISTANQCFTPLQFSAYHREGFRASVEAQAAEFLSDDRDSQEV